jgi:uncharacterized protein YndB with AHSA1/START domain
VDRSAEPIVVEQTFSAPIAMVWEAITDQDQMRQWFFEPMTGFRPEVGFETQFDVKFNGQVYTHQWKVTNVVLGRMIAYAWRYGGFAGDSSVTWELSETVNGTKLTLTHQGHETFPHENSAFRRESCQAGWEYFVRESLTAFLGSKQNR